MGVSTEITYQQVVLLGDLLARDNLNIPHMFAEDFPKEHIVNLSPTFTRSEGDQVIGSLFETGIADGQVAGHSKLQKTLVLCISCAPNMSIIHSLITSTGSADMTISVI